MKGDASAADGSSEAEEVEAAVTALVIGNDSFDEVERALDIFCPFEAIGMVRQEIRHAHFLAYVLDPQRPHSFGSEALRAFMGAVTRAVSEQGGQLSPLDVHLMALDSAEVRREWRSIDLLVLVPDSRLVMAVELKIDAREHGDQLSRYRAAVASEWPAAAGWKQLFLFLTKTGEAASEQAGDEWVAVSLEEVARGFAALVARRSGSEQAHVMLDAYVQMLRRHHLGDERLEWLAAQLWSQHGEALAFLADRRPDLLGKTFSQLSSERDRIAEQISQRSGLSIVPDRSTASFLRFGVATWDDAPGLLSGTGWKPSPRLLLLELEKRASTRTITARFELGPGDSDARERLFERLKAAGAEVGGNWSLSDKWRQLASKQLFKAKDDDVRTVDEASSAVREALNKFLDQHLPVYDQAIRGSGPARDEP
ncbi:MAG TPA: PD-(D/E)XK nuclease family protein [Allosphingosinicella sp.]|nr:PD-(D/E)XK nuclease family protein [Allosphingosinicella sp.]